MAVCILKFKTLQMSCYVLRYTTIGMYKDSSLQGQDALQTKGWVPNFGGVCCIHHQGGPRSHMWHCCLFSGYRFEYSVVASSFL